MVQSRLRLDGGPRLRVTATWRVKFSEQNHKEKTSECRLLPLQLEFAFTEKAWNDDLSRAEGRRSFITTTVRDDSESQVTVTVTPRQYFGTNFLCFSSQYNFRVRSLYSLLVTQKRDIMMF